MPETTTKDRIPRTIYWDKDLYRKLRILAASNDTTINAFVRDLVRKAVEENANGQ